MTIKAVIFDLDGVLVDAKEWHYIALNKALHPFGYNISKEDHLNKYDGLPTATKLDMLSETEGLPVRLHKTIKEIKQLFTIELIERKCKRNEEIAQTLNKLYFAGYKIAVASNAVSRTVHAMLNKTRYIESIRVILCNDSVSNPKPSPEIYYKAMEQLGVTAKESLIVEDNANGIAAAKASGANVLIVTSSKDVNRKNIFEKIEQLNK